MKTPIVLKARSDGKPSWIAPIVEPSVYSLYELDSNGEADVCHFYCSEKCRTKAEPDFIGTEHAAGDGDSDSTIQGTLCETCGSEIGFDKATR